MAKVAFLGLGVMGYPMAGHLKTKGGHEVTVYNRTTAKAGTTPGGDPRLAHADPHTPGDVCQAFQRSTERRLNISRRPS